MKLGLKGNIVQVGKLGANTNSTATVTAAIDMNDVICGILTIYVVGVSGAHVNHVVTMQYSPNQSSWIDGENKITGVGCLEIPATAARYVRLKVTTVEGGVSTSDIYLLGR